MEKLCNVILVMSFVDVMAMTSQNDVITDFLKFDFVTISLKNYNLVKSRNFRSPILKIKGRWGRLSPQRLTIFENLCLR